MFVTKPREIIEVVITEVVLKADVFTFVDLNVFVHQTLLAFAFAESEKAQKSDGINAVFHPPVHEYVAAVERDSGYIFRHVGQLFFDLLDQFRQQVFISIQTEHPFAGDRSVFESPVELIGVVVDPFVLEDCYIGVAFRYLKRPVGRKTVNNEYFLCNSRHVFQTTVNVKFLILCEDYD